MPTLTFDNSASSWETRALSRVDFCYIQSGETYKRSITQLRADSTFTLAPILRKNTFGNDIPVGYKANLKVNPANNKIADMTEFLSDLQNQKYTFLQVYFHKIPFGFTVEENIPFIYFQSNTRTAGSPNGIIVRKLSTNYSFNNSDININVDFMLSVDAFSTYQLFSNNPTL